jgi:hypothetical protein
MFLSKDDWINQRAYGLWEADGRPEGRGGEHWQQAAREYQMLELRRASVDGSELIERLKTMGLLMRAADPASAAGKAAKVPVSRRSAG